MRRERKDGLSITERVILGVSMLIPVVFLVFVASRMSGEPAWRIVLGLAALLLFLLLFGRVYDRLIAVIRTITRR